jgi:hypothetical protein
MSTLITLFFFFFFSFFSVSDLELLKQIKGLIEYRKVLTGENRKETVDSQRHGRSTTMLGKFMLGIIEFEDQMTTENAMHSRSQLTPRPQSPASLQNGNSMNDIKQHPDTEGPRKIQQK